MSELERKTTEIARRHGCDRAVFTVCWGEHERGEICQCKEDAKRELMAGSHSAPDANGRRTTRLVKFQPPQPASQLSSTDGNTP